MVTVCARPECGTSGGCAHRGPRGELCHFPPTPPPIPAGLMGWQCPKCGGCYSPFTAVCGNCTPPMPITFSNIRGGPTDTESVT